MQRIVAGLVHPHSLDCCRPSTLRPIPPATSPAPGQSMGAGARRSAGFAMVVSTSAMMAIGTLTQKMERQVHSVR